MSVRSSGPAPRAFASEKEFEATVEECARWNGWLAYHTYWSVHSEPGFPDLVMVRPPRVLFVELKMPGGPLTEAQAEWRDALERCDGAEYHLWRSRDWTDGVIETLLSRRECLPLAVVNKDAS